MLRKVLYVLAAVIVIVAILFFAIVPGRIDRSLNTTLHKANPDHRVSWYDSIPFVADLHCDELLWHRDLLARHSYGHVDVPRMQEANVALEVFTIVSKTPSHQNYDHNSGETDQIALLSFAQLRAPGDWFSLKSRALHQCDDLHASAGRSGGTFRVITRRSELEQYIRDRSTNRKLTAGMLGIEGAQCLENDVNNLDVFYKAGVRYIGLAHFFDNEWAGSAHGMKKGGLTAKGKELLHRMEQLHIMIDLAHQSTSTIADIFANTKGTLMVSHTGVRGLCDNGRNLTDAQIQEIGRRDGIIGIGMWETAICGTDAAATARSIKYVADRIGVEHVAMGSDFDGAVDATYDITGFTEVVYELVKLGYSRTDIEKIMGGNVRDFWLRNLP